MSDAKNCVEKMLKVTELAGQDLRDDQVEQIQQHIDECSQCLAYWGIEEEIQILVKKSCASTAPAYLRAQVKARLVVLHQQMQDGNTSD